MVKSTKFGGTKPLMNSISWGTCFQSSFGANPMKLSPKYVAARTTPRKPTSRSWRIRRRRSSTPRVSSMRELLIVVTSVGCRGGEVFGLLTTLFAVVNLVYDVHREVLAGAVEDE